MSNLAGQRQIIQVEDISAGNAVSEALLSKLAAAVNFINEKQIMSRQFGVNGPYSLWLAYPQLDVGPSEEFFENYEIVNVLVKNETTGSGGATEVDIKVREDGTSVWTSIFATRPKFLSTSSNKAKTDSKGTYGFSAGVTQPILNAGAQNLNAKCEMRFDLISAMTGASDVSVEIFYRPR